MAQWEREAPESVTQNDLHKYINSLFKEELVPIKLSIGHDGKLRMLEIGDPVVEAIPAEYVERPVYEDEVIGVNEAGEEIVEKRHIATVRQITKDRVILTRKIAQSEVDGVIAKLQQKFPELF